MSGLTSGLIHAGSDRQGSSGFVSGARLLLAASVAALGCAVLSDGSESSGKAAALARTTEGPYSELPNHPWNRVHRALFLHLDEEGQEEGLNFLDPPLWQGSTYLLRGPRQAEAIEALGAFVDSKAASLVRDPVRRAVFQRDLWAVFDWLSRDALPRDTGASDAAERESRAGFRRLLARAIGQVALSDDEIEALPDNYARAVAAGRYPTDPGDLAGDGPVLPPDLFSPEGEWVAIDAPRDESCFHESLVPIHAERFASRSSFTVHLRVPGGRRKTLEYLQRLSSFDAPRVPAPANVLSGVPIGELEKPLLALNPETPQLPAGSAVALVRRMLLVDNQGRLVASPLVESAQFRWFRSMGTAPRLGEVRLDFAALRAEQRTVEFELDRGMLFADDAGGLRAIGAGEKDFDNFITQGFDPFDEPKRDREQLRTTHLDRCVGCHGAPGIFSVQVYTRINSGAGTQLAVPALRPTARLRLARLGDAELTAVSFKSQRYEWGLLQALLDAPAHPARKR